MSSDTPRDGAFQLLAAATTRRLLQSMRDICAEAEDDPLQGPASSEIVLSASAGRKAGRSVIFAADAAIAAPDWLVLCETRPARAGHGAEEGGEEGAVFGFVRRLPGGGEPREFVRLAYSVLFAREADSAGLDHYARRLSGGAMTRPDMVAELLASPEALARPWSFALLPLDGELSAVFGPEGFDDLAPPRFLIED